MHVAYRCTSSKHSTELPKEQAENQIWHLKSPPQLFYEQNHLRLKRIILRDYSLGIQTMVHEAGRHTLTGRLPTHAKTGNPSYRRNPRFSRGQ